MPIVGNMRSFIRFCCKHMKTCEAKLAKLYNQNYLRTFSEVFDTPLDNPEKLLRKIKVHL